eukprot:139486_1
MIANVRKITSSLSFLHFRPENQVLNNGLNDDTDTDCRIRLCFAIVRYVLRLLQRQLIPKLVQKNHCQSRRFHHHFPNHHPSPNHRFLHLLLLDCSFSILRNQFQMRA